MARLEIALLGPIQVRLDGQPIIGFGYNKVRALLAYLAVEEGLHRRDALAALLWPEVPESSARKSLRSALATLRQAIGDAASQPPFLLITRETVQFNPGADAALDVATVQAMLVASAQHTHPDSLLCPECAAHLADMTRLYRGEFLPQVAVPDSVAFEEWVMLTRERLHRQMLDALARLSAYHEGQGQDEVARQYAWRTLALEPWDEAAHRCLMRVSVRSGQRNSALVQYERCRKVLADELGVDPSAETIALYERIRASAVEARVAVDHPPPKDPPSSGPSAPAFDMTDDPPAHRSSPVIVTLYAPSNEHRPSLSGRAEQLSVFERQPTPDKLPSTAPATEVNSIPCSLADTIRRASRTLPATNLPAPPTLLFGREQEVAALSKRLRDGGARLLTLVGPPGIGKTRLGLEVASRLLDGFDDGVYLVELAPIREPMQVAAAIAQPLGVKEAGDRPVAEMLQSYLRDKRLLLLLDNFEHVLDAAPLVAELLARCPRLNILATSRAPLLVRAERQFLVAPLALPDPTPPADVLVVARAPAVALFVDRAQASAPDFVLTDTNAAAVAEICIHLEGLPLAIELAAARSTTIAPAALLAQLDHCLAVLNDGPRDLPERQRTLRTAIDWSYDLLSVDQQRLFARLGLFVGGCMLEAAKAVCSPQGELPESILEGLTTLVQKSLLQCSLGADGEMRFSMLENIREYALEQLAGLGEDEALRSQHAMYYLRFAEASIPKLHGSDVLAWLARLEQEHGNLRAALCWCEASAERTTHGLQLAGALWPFWQFRNYFAEGRAWIEIFLNRSRDMGQVTPHVHARALLGAGWLAYHQDDYACAAAHGTESLALYSQESDTAERADTLNLLGFCAAALGDYGAGITHLEESVALNRVSGDRYTRALAVINLGFLHNDCGDVGRAQPLFEEGLAWGRQAGHPIIIARALNALGELARMRGEYRQAGEYYTESFALFQDMWNYRGIATLHHNLGCVALYHGHHARARTHFTHSLRSYRELGDKAGTAAALAGLAGVIGIVGQSERAARIFGAAQALREASGAPMIPPDRYDYDRNVAAVRARLSEARFTAAWTAGQAMGVEAAIGEAMEYSAVLPEQAPQFATRTVAGGRG